MWFMDIKLWNALKFCSLQMIHFPFVGDVLVRTRSSSLCVGESKAVCFRDYLDIEEFCLKLLKFWVSWEKSPELASKYAWVRPENRSELGAQNRKNNSANGALCALHFSGDELDKLIQGSSKPWMVQFYSSWCGHCIHFQPTFSEFGARVEGWWVVTLLCVFCLYANVLLLNCLSSIYPILGWKFNKSILGPWKIAETNTWSFELVPLCQDYFLCVWKSFF